MNKQKGIAQVAVMVVMLFLAVALPLTTKLVQQNQENRSSASTRTCTQSCFSPYKLGQTSCSGFNIPTATYSGTGLAGYTCGNTTDLCCTLTPVSVTEIQCQSRCSKNFGCMSTGSYIGLIDCDHPKTTANYSKDTTCGRLPNGDNTNCDPIAVSCTVSDWISNGPLPSVCPETGRQYTTWTKKSGSTCTGGVYHQGTEYNDCTYTAPVVTAKKGYGEACTYNDNCISGFCTNTANGTSLGINFKGVSVCSESRSDVACSSSSVGGSCTTMDMTIANGAACGTNGKVLYNLCLSAGSVSTKRCCTATGGTGGAPTCASLTSQGATPCLNNPGCLWDTPTSTCVIKANCAVDKLAQGCGCVASDSTTRHPHGQTFCNGNVVTSCSTSFASAKQNCTATGQTCGLNSSGAAECSTGTVTPPTTSFDGGCPNACDVPKAACIGSPFYNNPTTNSKSESDCLCINATTDIARIDRDGCRRFYVFRDNNCDVTKQYHINIDRCTAFSPDGECYNSKLECINDGHPVVDPVIGASCTSTFDGVTYLNGKTFCEGRAVMKCTDGIVNLKETCPIGSVCASGSCGAPNPIIDCTLGENKSKLGCVCGTRPHGDKFCENNVLKECSTGNIFPLKTCGTNQTCDLTSKSCLPTCNSSNWTSSSTSCSGGKRTITWTKDNSGCIGGTSHQPTEVVDCTTTPPTTLSKCDQCKQNPASNNGNVLCKIKTAGKSTALDISTWIGEFKFITSQSKDWNADVDCNGIVDSLDLSFIVSKFSF